MIVKKRSYEHYRWLFAITAVILSFFAVYGVIFAAAPVVNVTIELKKTGSEPFDTSDTSDNCTEAQTWDSNRTFSDGSAVDDGNNGPNLAGRDACSDNDVVRIGDAVTYKVEASNNDSDVDQFIATVSLDPYNQTTQLPDPAGTIHQTWIEIPSGCEIDPLIVNPISSIDDTDGDGIAETLVCNMGYVQEGTNKVFFPAAKVLGASTDGSESTINDSVVGASVSVTGISNTPASGNNGTSAPDTDGPVEALVTGDFRTNLKKDLVGLSFTDDDDNPATPDVPVYPGLLRKDHPDGRRGYIMKYDISANYLKGSMFADDDDSYYVGGVLTDNDKHGDTVDGDGITNFDLLDVMTDNNINNDTPAQSSGGLLYDWDTDPAFPDCQLLGNHGATASVNCTQINLPIDYTSSTQAPDGFNDPNIHIDLDNIDVNDPDQDSKLFNVRITVWMPYNADVLTHQTCGGGSCVQFFINEAQGYDPINNTISDFTTVSTEDAGGNNLDNYNGAQEPGNYSPGNPANPSDNLQYALFKAASSGSWSAMKSFHHYANGSDQRLQEQLVAKNEVVPFFMQVIDYRNIDGAVSQACDKLDIHSYEFVEIPAVAKYPYAKLLQPYFNRTIASGATDPGSNPGARLHGDTVIGSKYDVDVSSLITNWFTDVPYVNDPTTNEAAYINELMDEKCYDDVNNDGSIVFMDATGALIDENGAPTAGAVDWYEDPNMMPGTPSSVTRIRMDGTYDKAFLEAAYGASSPRWIFGTVYDLKVLPDATGYGPSSYIPNYMTARYNQYTGALQDPLDPGWRDWVGDAAGTSGPTDSNDLLFGWDIRYADRNILVDSGIGLEKNTDPAGIKVVRGGDVVPFILKPSVFGLWTGTETADVTDNLPPGTDYIGGSEEFSIDGGATWMDYTTYQASSPDVTLTSSPTPGAQDPITWSFGSLDAVVGDVDQMPWIRYKVKVDPSLTSGNFKNTACMISPNIAVDRLTTDTNDDGIDDIGNGVGDDVCVTYKLTILPKFGFDVLKQVGQEVYNVNEPFVFDLTYKNLGGEAYTGGEFIDILPFNGDAATTIGGQQSQRDPATDFNGYYEFTEASFGNGESFWVTDVNPATLNLDPCASSNTAVGYVPSAGDICHQDYVNNNNMLPDGVASGTFSANWLPCIAGASPLDVASDCPIAPEDITAIRFEAPSVPTTGGKTVSITLDPVGNVGGEPVYTVDGNGVQIVDWANSPNIGDIYTNSFGGRIPEISLNTISNDATVTPVWGTVGDLVWWDYDDDGTVNGADIPIGGQQLQIFDSAGNPLYVDPANNNVVITQADLANYEAIMGVTLSPYTTTTNGSGIYEFVNLPQGDYIIEVINPLSIQTYDLDDGLAATDSSSVFTLNQETDAVTGNITGVQDRLDVDFGYRLSVFDVELRKSLITTGPFVLGQEVEFEIDVRNNGPDAAPDVEITDTPTGLAYVAASANPTVGTYADPVWDVGQLNSGQSESMTISYTITAADITDPVFNFAEVTDDGSGDYGSDIDSNPGDNTSGDDADDPETDLDLESGTDTHDDEAGVPLSVVAGPSIKITKTAGTAADGEFFINDPAGTVTFTFVVENDGGTDLSDITITDDAGTPTDPGDDVTLSAIECPLLAGPLTPTSTVTCTLDLPVDTTNSPYTNNASTTGTPTDDDGNPIPGVDDPTDDDPSDVIVPPAIDIVKTAGTAVDGDDYIATGSGSVTFTYVVTNTGGTHLIGATIIDDAGTPTDSSDDVTVDDSTCIDLMGPIAPGDSVTCTADIEVTNGNYENNASVSATPSDENSDSLVDDSGIVLFDDPEADDPATVLYPDISIDKTLYETHDAGSQCNTAAAVDSLVLVDKVPTDKEITYCFVVTNTGGVPLTLPTLSDPTLGITDADMSVIGTPIIPLAPGDSVTFYYEHTTDTSINNEATTNAFPSEPDGTPTPGQSPVDDMDSNAIFTYVFDPPFGEKTGTFNGQDVITWEMVWINDSTIIANGVVITDEPPVDTTYNGNLSCTTLGSTVISQCQYNAPTPAYPRGQIVAIADIHPDTGISDPDLATNAIRIGFDVLVDQPEVGGVFENQAELSWDPDGDGVDDFAVLSDSPQFNGSSDPTIVSIESLSETGTQGVLLLLVAGTLVVTSAILLGKIPSKTE